MKNSILIGIVLIIIFGIGVYFLTRPSTVVVENPEGTIINDPVATPEVSPRFEGELPPPVVDNEKVSKIGTSASGRDILAFHYGTGEKELLFVGGIHGGYSWNTALVAYELMEYLEENPDVIKENVKVTVIPVLNPDGLSKVVPIDGKFTEQNVDKTQTALIEGRFNDNVVDLNRNFDCDWKESALWQSRTVNGGAEVFSEPESQALKGYVDTHAIAGAVVWYSAEGAVYASACDGPIIPATRALLNTFAQAADYPARDVFDAYAVTGDMVNWLAKKKIPAISVLLTTHQDVEWDKNRAGIDAVLEYYAR